MSRHVTLDIAPEPWGPFRAFFPESDGRWMCRAYMRRLRLAAQIVCLGMYTQTRARSGVGLFR